MYTPRSFAEDRPEVLFDFIEANPLGILVTSSPAGLYGSHIPFVFDRSRGPHGTLEAHIARANPHHRQLPITNEALVIFTGPDAYVTPAWYQTKRETGKVVPTWNYVAVHAYGAIRFTDDTAVLRRTLEALTSRHEARQATPWSIADAPPEYIEQQLKAIVGLEIPITRLEGKWKMSQNRVAADIEGVIEGLSASTSANDQTVGAIVAERRPPTSE